MEDQTLILLHGALGAVDQLEPLKQALEGSMQIACFNFSGHGGQAFETGFSIDQFTQELAHYIHEKQLKKPNIFGYSMGGYVALTLASRDPGIVGKIITLGTKMEWSPEISSKEVKMLDPEKLQAKVPAFAQALAHRHGQDHWKFLMKRTADLMQDLGHGKALTPETFSKIHNDVCVCIGAQDQMVSMAESQSVATVLPNGRLHIFDDFHHPIERINTQQLADTIKIFINETA